MELFWVYSNERKGLNPSDSEMKYSAFSGVYKLLYSIPQNGVESYVKIYFF